MVVQVVDFSLADSNPLNPLGLKLRKLIWESLDNAEKDDHVTSLIFTGGSSRAFSAGADLTEFGKLEGAASISGVGEGFYPLVELVNKIEGFPKPIVAAISGVALGGGLEVALSCHYRVTDKTGSFGLPEVHVGVIPGAGGTQRLPRLVGLTTALDMILTGNSIDARHALEFGLVDHVAIDKPLLQAAKAWAEWAELMPLDDRRVGSLTIQETSEQAKKIFQFAIKKLPHPGMGGQGVHAALKAVEACRLPISEGSQVELSYFLETLAGSQGKARRHAFFAVRQAQKPLGRAPKGHPLLANSLENEQAAVIGAGLMGSGIALVLLQAGFTVYLVDVYDQSLQKGVAFLKNTIESYVKKGRMTREKAEKLQGSLKPTQNMNDLSTCKLVVEAVIEDLTVKKNILSSLEKIVPFNAILLSNTSTLDIDAMASVLSPARRSLFGGWHFFSPAHVMKLVEIVVGKATSHETICVLQQLTKRIKKIGVVVGNCDGFVGNRMLISYSAETTLLLEEGVATVQSVDKALLKFGMAMGPFQMGDLAGLDIGYNIRKQRGWVRVGDSPPRFRPQRYPELGDDLVSKLKRFGQKSGKVSTMPTMSQI